MIGMRIRRAAAAVAVLVVGWLVLAPRAEADPVGDATAALRTTGVYVDAAVKDRGAKIGDVPLPDGVKIAVLPDAGIPALRLATQIGSALGAGPNTPLTIGVFTVTDDGHASFRAASSTFCPGFADSQAQAAVAAHTTELRNRLDLTTTIADFVRGLQDGPLDTGGTSCADAPADGVPGNVYRGGAPGGAAAPAYASGGGSAWPWLVGIAAVGAGGIGGLVLYSRRVNKQQLELARARTAPYYDQLAGEINTLDPKDNAKAKQARSDASERFAAAGSLLATADTSEKVGIARRTVLEGLYAARTAREALGIDPGPPLPPIEPARYEQLGAPQQVTVQGQTFAGYPSYTPGAPHYFGGGSGVPGGWYQTPFWETLLLGSVLSGGFGDGGGSW